MIYCLCYVIVLAVHPENTYEGNQGRHISKLVQITLILHEHTEAVISQSDSPYISSCMVISSADIFDVSSLTCVPVVLRGATSTFSCRDIEKEVLYFAIRF